MGHPSHVHIFKHSIKALEERGHQTRILARDKDIVLDLLDNMGLDYVVVSSVENERSPVQLLLEYKRSYINTLREARDFNPDVFVSRFSPPMAHISSLLGKKSLMLELNEKNAPLATTTIPFASRVISPKSFSQSRGEKHHTYDGFHELAYLHPNYFEPSKADLRAHGVDPDGNYFVLRFVSWDAYHDVGSGGFSTDYREEIIKKLSQIGDVYVSSEMTLQHEDATGVPVPPHLMHDLLYYSDLYIGDSGTMPIEAGILGTPSICYNPLIDEWGIFSELVDEYNIICTPSTQSEVISKAEEYSSSPTIKEDWQQKRNRLLDDKIDLTRYLVEQIEEIGTNETQRQ